MSQLYDPANAGNPTKIKAIQEHLQTLQKGPQAWFIANALLSDNGTDLRFFGALTFTVKINNDWCVTVPIATASGLLILWIGNN